MLSVSNLASRAYECLPQMPELRMSTPTEITKKVSSLAIPLMALAGASLVEGTEAFGTLGCVICLAAGGGPTCVIPCAIALATAPIPLF
jgi:hypothetical protein